MSIAAHGAAVRGDDYQHLIGLYQAGRLLNDPSLESVSIEDADGGAFDDIVIRPKPGLDLPVEYIQAKSSVYVASAVDETWLTTSKSSKGKSALQRFYGTWTQLTAAGEPFELKLVTNKNFDDRHPVLKMIDIEVDRLHRHQLRALGPRASARQHLDVWAAHLETTFDDLIDFVTDVQFIHISPATIRTMAAAELRNAGLRHEPAAVDLGVAVVRSWVTSGAGPQDRRDVQAAVAARGLLAHEGELVLAVHGIDHVVLDRPPNASIDIVNLYPDVDPYARRELQDPTNWHAVVLPALEQARRDLSGYRSKRLRVEAAMRLPMHFAVGRTFSDVTGWVLSTDQRGTEWRTDAARESADLQLTMHELGRGDDLAVAVAITHDVTIDVTNYLSAAGLPVGRLLVLARPSGSDDLAVPGPGWAVQAARDIREQTRQAQNETGTVTVHLFMAAPAALALFIGHHWNLIRDTTVYDHNGITYSPSVTLHG